MSLSSTIRSLLACFALAVLPIAFACTPGAGEGEGEGEGETGPLAIADVNFWAYQIQRIIIPESQTALVNSSYDMVVIEPTRTEFNYIYSGGPTDVGSPIVEAQDPDPEVDAVRPCVLFSWVPGAPLGDGAGDFGYRLLGRMCASLQQHGRTFKPPDMDRMRHWDRIFYYDKELDPIIIEDTRYDHLFSRGRRNTIARAGEIATDVLDETWKSGDPHVVHGDLHEWNAHVVASRLYAFDFEDVMIATPAQDVSVCLYSSRASSRAWSCISR